MPSWLNWHDTPPSRGSSIAEVPEVSVIVPVYNTEAFIRDCLASLQNQTLSNFEALIVDDASPDGAIVVAEEFSSSDSRFKIIRHGRNRGLPAARNSGLRLARGRYVYHLDSDDLLVGHALERMVEAADLDGSEILVFNGVRFSRPDEAHPYQRVREERKNVTFEEEPTLWSGGSLFLFLFQRAFLTRIEAVHDEELQIVEDEIYLTKVLPRALHISMITDALHQYRRGHSSIAHLSEYWPYEKWIDYFGYPCYVSRHLRSHRAAWYYNLLHVLSSNACMLICAMEQLENSHFHLVLNRFATAYQGLDAQIACNPAAQPWPQKVVVPTHLHRLIKLLINSDTETVELELRKLQEHHLDPLIFRSKLAFKNVNRQLGLEMAHAAIRERPGIALSHHELALLEAKSGNFIAAERAEIQALKLHATLAESHVHLSKLLLRKGEHHDALHHVQRALELNPYAADWLVTLGRVHETMEAWDLAAAAYQAAIAREDRRAEWHAKLARVHEKMERWDVAAAAYQAALARDHSRADWQAKLARLRAKGPPAAR